MAIEDTRQEIEELLGGLDEAVLVTWTDANSTVHPNITLVPLPREEDGQMGSSGKNIDQTLTGFLSSAEFTEASRPLVNHTLTVSGTVWKIIRASNAMQFGYIKVFCERISRVAAVHENQVGKM